ncbi:HNH endonuclease [Schaalia sp.]|uniref:HNH endonuclease n=1 Tax=Schaalia sp. TaxID=2691890 RepID=UPI003D0FC9C1
MSTVDDWTSRPGKWRRAFTLELIRRFGAVCCICGLPIRRGEESCQHLTPRSQGGRTTFDNCRPAHRSCNYSAGARQASGPAGLVADGLAAFTRRR